MNIKFLHKSYLWIMAFAASASFCSCKDWIYDDLDPCTVTYKIKFRYDHNMKYADAFPAEVRSVNVWAFDEEGNLAWQSEAAGDPLSDPDFSITADLAPGTYDFIVWGGLAPASPFKVENASRPARKEDLGCELRLSDGPSGKYMNHELPDGLYHGRLDDVRLEVRDTEHVVQTVTIPLKKNTNEVQVILQHIDGSPIGRTDFSVSISAENSSLAWDNEVLPSDAFIYTPWSTVHGSADMDNPSVRAEASTRDTQTSVTTLLNEMAMNRMIAGKEQILTVTRNTDGRQVIRIPLIQYLLLVKGNYHRDISDQEYLDRQDEYSVFFFLDHDNNWYMAGGIYINGWAVVPPQESEM